MAQPNPHAGVVRSKRQLYSGVITIATIAMVLGLFMVALAQPTISPPTVSAAALTVDLDQCANQTTPCSWQNGDLNGNNSSYAEGLVVPFRLAIEGLTAGSHTIHINYDFTSGGHEAYDFLATYNATEVVDLCASGGGGVSSLCPSLPAPNVQAFPSDPFVVPGTLGSLSVAGAEAFSGVSRDLTLYGGTITSITGPVHAGNTNGNSTGDFTVTFTSTGSAVLLAWGGHLAQSAYWINSDGSPDGAGQVSGAPWHMRTQNLDDSGNKNQDRSIQPSALQAPTPTPTNTPTDTRIHQPIRRRIHQPIRRPTHQPIRQLTRRRTHQPIRRPTHQLTRRRTHQPIRRPTHQPIRRRTHQPIRRPTRQRRSYSRDAPPDSGSSRSISTRGSASRRIRPWRVCSTYRIRSGSTT